MNLFFPCVQKKVERKSKLKAGQVRIVNILITFFMELRSVIGKKIILLRFILHFWKTQNKPQNTFGYAGMISNIWDNISGGWECLENHLKYRFLKFEAGFLKTTRKLPSGIVSKFGIYAKNGLIRVYLKSDTVLDLTKNLLYSYGHLRCYSCHPLQATRVAS